jgi:hypothetical protein
LRCFASTMIGELGGKCAGVMREDTGVPPHGRIKIRQRRGFARGDEEQCSVVAEATNCGS